MERNKLIKLGVLGAAGVGMFVLAQSLNAPAPVQQVSAPTVAPVQQVEDKKLVLVAIADVARGARVAEGMLDWREWPESAIQPNMIVHESRPQAVEEMIDAVVRSDIYTGEPINEAKLVRAGDSGLMAALLSPGMRAVTTRVSVESAAGGFIMPGDRVDIIQTVQLPKKSSAGQGGRQEVTQYASRTIFSNVKVLAMNSTFATGPDSPPSFAGVSYATFELAPGDAEQLEEAVKGGSISLMLRGLQPNGPARSAARKARQQQTDDSTLVVYRNGQQTQTAIRGR